MQFAQLQWVPDGYNQTLSFSYHGGASNRVVVRPMTHAERLDLWSLSPDTDMLAGAVKSRVVYGSLDPHLLEPMEWRKALDLILRPGDKQELEDMRNLAAGVRLECSGFRHLNEKGCNWCQKFWYDPLTGEDAKDRGIIMDRPAHAELLCQVALCPNGTPEKQNAFSPKNRLAYMHFLRCQSAASFPDDPIVKRNAEVILRAKAQAKEGTSAGLAARV